MYLVLALVYLTLCAFVGFLGRDRIIGFSGIFLLSILLSPIVMAFVVLLTGPKRDHLS